MVDKLPWKQLSLVVGVLLTLALFYLAWVFPTFPGDEPALLKLQSLQTGWLDSASLALFRLGRFPVAAVTILAVVGLLWLLRHRADGSMVLLSVVPMLVGQALKSLVNRPRPDHLLLGTMPSSMSFPSGHAVYAVLLCGILIVLAEKLVRPAPIRRGVQVGLLLLILAMGTSRVYLGHHWPSDVIGSYLFGFIALLGLVQLRIRLAKHQP